MTKRKRRKIAKAGPRYPTSNHRLYNEHGGALWRRIVDEGVRFGHLNPQLGSEVGRLCFNDAITSIEAAAASRVAEIYGRYERTQGMRRSAASPTYMIGYGGSDTSEEENPDHALWTRRAKRQFDELQAAIPSPRARTLLEQLCVDDQSIGPINLMDMRLLLRQLAEIFRFAPPSYGSSRVSIAGPHARPQIRV